MVRETTVDSGCGAAGFPLSPMQQGMLFHREGEGTRGVDVEQVVAELRHPVSAPEFEQAWNTVLARHEALRASFAWPADQEPRQVFLPAGAVSLTVRVLDLSGADDVGPLVEQYVVADRRAGFSELTAPLLRVTLFLNGDDRAWFVCTYHHLVLDARGMVTLFREVMDLHDAYVRGERPALPEPRAYREYLGWLKTLDLRRAEAFWREQLQGLSGPTSLPLPAPALPVGDGAPGELATQLSLAATQRLRDAAQRHGVTVNTVLQGAWAIVLSQYTGEADVVFGAVRACRHVPVEGAATMAGMLINTVPMRVRLAPAASVDHWLRALREQWVAMRDFEHSPLMQVQRWSGWTDGRALFDTLFNFQEPSWMEALRQLGGPWRKRTFDLRSQPGYPLALDIYGDRAIRIRAFYDRRRLADDGVARLLRHYRAAIDALCSDRIDTLAEVSLLDPTERHQVLQDFNRTAADYDREATIHGRFEAQAAAAPDRVAVADGRTALTYADLNRRANQLAHRLRKHGVGPDVAVAVCMHRSAEMVVAWMAALKAGGAFVPLDPSYPAERLAFQLDDCGAPVILTQAPLLGALPATPANVTTLTVTAEGGEVAGEPADNPAGGAGARHLAYVIYTSGSTGQPKGVEIEHRALGNLVTWHRRTYQITPDDRGTQLASPAFDASVWEIWPYLTAGASVHLPDEDTRIAPAKLWHWLAEEKITVCFLPTPLAEAALAEPWPEGMALRALLTGGDQLKRPAPTNFPCALVNHYGPTESTVVATASVVDRLLAGAPPIGRPIANTTAYVLDQNLRPVPVGIAGELHIGGESLARGYRRRPELTAERFVLCPFVAGEGEGTVKSAVPARLYRTGDLVRWRADGQLEFLGRLDHQVKIRGCRIELGEIEAALQRHARVREAVVVARPDDRGQSQLVGYVVGFTAAGSVDGRTPEMELTDFLRQSLPSYMVPVAIVALDQWPLTPNGKVDRRALPAPVIRASGAFVAPQTREQELVARVWAEVLGRESVGLHDNFFELGGHSLLAAQAITRLNAALNTSISVRVLFDHPTVVEFARALETQAVVSPRAPVLRAKRRAVAPELELVPPR